MSHILKMATVIGMLAFAATGVAESRPIYFRNNQPQPGYAGQMFATAPAAQFVPGRGIVGESCDMPSSACSNDYRIND